MFPKCTACVVCLSAALALSSFVRSATDGTVSAAFAADSSVAATTAMVSSAHPLASEVGVEIMRKGGNAFDAAVAVAAVLPLVDPGASALSGAGAALFYQPGQDVRALSWFGRSPVSPEFAKRRRELLNRESLISARPPGSLAAFAALLEAHGTMTLAQVLAPAIEHAEKGVTVTEDMHRTLKRAVERLRRYPNAAEQYLVNGEAPPVGSTLKYPNLAKTMRIFAAKGPDALYKGEVGKELVEYMQQNGGLLGWKDLELVGKPAWHPKPLKSTYRGYTVYAVPPVANGTQVLLMLNMLEHFNLKEMPEAKRAHIIAEVMKLSMIDRATYLGDPAFVEVPVEKLTSKAYAKDRASAIKEDKILPWTLPWPEGAESTSTTHFVVVDKARNVVSITNSVGGLGENWHIGRTGLILSGGVNGMSQNPKHPNYAEPGKYQQMTMGPVLVFDAKGKPVLALGAAGGHVISQAIAQVIVNFIDRGMSAQDATAAPRVSYPTAGVEKLTVQAEFSKDTLESLKALGYQTRPGRSAAIHAIAIDPSTGKLTGGADPGGEGRAVGY